MKKYLVIVLLFLIVCKAWGLNEIIKKKYPNVLINDDYNILSEKDLAIYTREIKPTHFSDNNNHDFIYWQCFPRDHISMTLIDAGYSSEDIGGKENFGNITISIWMQNNISHEYYMRRPWTIGNEEEIFHLLQKLMKDEKYVCLAGRFSRHEDVMRDDGKKHHVYYWVFENLKTKKGCHAYFYHEGCDQ